MRKTKLLDKFINHLYRSTSFYSRDVLDKIHLIQPTFYSPSADASYLLNWERILSQFVERNIMPSEIRNALSNIVKLEKYEDLNFEFKKIESLTHSKSFGRDYHATINGSWFRNVADWGKAMYPNFDDCNQLSGLDDEDFAYNINYIENREGFTQGTIDVDYYEWIDRYIGIQSGSSHHSAMLIHQLTNQKRGYERKAKINKYSLDISQAEAICESCYLFIAANQAFTPLYSSSEGETEYILRKFVAKRVFISSIDASKVPSSLFIIQKSDLKVECDVFHDWLSECKNRGVIIDFVDMLKSPFKYCVEAYSHHLDSVYLGDPNRENDKTAKQIKIEVESH